MVKKQETHGLGWIPDRPDNRDHLYSVKSYEPIAQTYLSIVDLTSEMPPVSTKAVLVAAQAMLLAPLFGFSLPSRSLKNSLLLDSSFITMSERWRTA